MIGRRIASALAGLLAAAAASCGDPSFVEKVIIVNRFEYTVHAEVGDGSRGWLNLGGVERESEETIEQVIDFGERWVFRFRFRDLDPVEVALTRSELAAAGWRVEVPQSLVERLRKRGEPPSFTGGG